MVLGCMTCLFTVPASAETPLADSSAEALPENLLFVVEGTELTLKEGKAIAAAQSVLDAYYRSKKGPPIGGPFLL